MCIMPSLGGGLMTLVAYGAHDVYVYEYDFHSYSVGKKTLCAAKITFRELKRKQEITDYECSICLEKYGRRGKCAVTECKHVFHYSCLHKYIQEYRNDKCPLCRHKIAK